MKLIVRAELVYRFEPPTPAVFKIQAAHWPGQTIVHEVLTVEPPTDFRSDVEPETGARMLRANLSGEVAVTYEATVENGVLQILPQGLAQYDWTDMPPEVLTWVWPSRYCPSDAFVRFVTREFDGLAGSDRVQAILDWISAHIDYVPGVSNVETTASRTFIDRAGVCRDFSHLGITLCRASGIPARAVSAYAHQLQPPDFHAIFEVYLAGSWWLVDPTGLAPIGGIVRIACGHDAADIAFLSTQGSAQLVHQSVTVTEAG
jgi:transglutaminase-like putative cysteine protease